MPLKKSHNRKSAQSSKTASPVVRKADHLAFYPLLILTLVVWVIYRRLFEYPVWFDETVGKAIFFGLPVWLYVTVSGCKEIVTGWAPAQLYRGLLLGIAFGGIFGFVAAILAAASAGHTVAAAPLFVSDRFWWEFFLALMTGFWETLFFFSWIMVVLQELYPRWPLAKQVVMVATIFAIFHLPNALLRSTTGPTEVIAQMIILFLFGVGQAFVFARRHNAYALALSQAIWGMVLLVHLSR